MGNKSSKLDHSSQRLLKSKKPRGPKTVPESSQNVFFQPLPSHRHIRLVDIQRTSNQIQTTYRVVPLDEAPPYCALSYTWGIPTQRDLELRMQAPHISITENLTSAMYFLGSIFPGTYWIDALCINQKDDAEKSSQVAMMREIYSTSKRVVVFLGPKDDDTDMACHLIAKLCELFQNRKIDLEGAAIEISLPISRKYPFEDKKLRELGLPLRNAPDWLALANFLSRPYFQRIWVLQELVMAPEGIVVLCGSFQLPWAALQMTHRILVATGWRQEIKQVAGDRGKSFEMDALEFVPIVTTLMGLRNLGLQSLLDMTRYFAATDPRDKIFALLGMTGDGENQGGAVQIRPNYGNSVQQVYTEITGTFIMNGSLDLLSSVAGPESTRIKGLPSWVPDYSSVSHNGSFAKGYKAAGETPVLGTWSSDSSTLKIRALQVDSIKTTSRLDGSSDPANFILEAFSMAARHFSSGDEFDWLNALAQKQSIPSLNAFWKTMIGEGNTLRRSRLSDPRPQDMQNHFATFMAQLFASLLFSSSAQARRRMIAIEDSPALMTMGDPTVFRTRCLDKIVFNRFFITEGDRMGLASRDLKNGDKVMVFSGGGPVYITREQQGRYRFIGDSYVYGLMHGEALTKSDGNFSEIILE